MEMTLRWQGPWESKNIDQIPKGHEILAEFPNVAWGWECDLYSWVLRDPNGRRYLASTSHGHFHEVELASIAECIQEHYAMAELLETVFVSMTQ